MELLPRPGVVVGAAPILRALADRIGLVAVVDQMVAWDPERCRLSPGERILALVLNLLTDRQPLYQVTDAFRLTDVPLLLGPGVAAEDLTDDALGRALDKLAAAGPAAVFSAVAARAYAVEAIDRGGMHFDTTSRSLYGEYPTADGTAGVTPRHGHSKDHRDDLKQILFTCFVNREGVPLMGTVEDGNRSDKRLNRQQIDRIVRAFSPATMQDLVYIADSALVTGPNLDALAATPLAWLSRLPDTFGAAARAKAAAWAADAWIPIGRVAQAAHAATYAASEQTGSIGDRPYRLVVYRSSSLDRRKAKTLDRELARARAAAEQAATALTAQDFACAADAEAAAATFQVTAPHWWPCTTAVVSATVRDKRPRPGRPRRDDPTSTHTVYRVQVTWGPRQEAAVEAELQRRSVFVLITTLPPDRYDAAALLREYKGQTSVEQRFQFLKDPAFVDAVFLQKPERIQALGYVMLLALLLFSCLERRVRQAPDPFPTAYRGAVTRPTGQLILHHCRGIQVLWRDDAHRYLAVPAAHRPALRVILQALAFSETIYTTVPARAAPY
jgi:transposase